MKNLISVPQKHHAEIDSFLCKHRLQIQMSKLAFIKKSATLSYLKCYQRLQISDYYMCVVCYEIWQNHSRKWLTVFSLLKIDIKGFVNLLS